MVWCLNFQDMLETPFPFFISKKPGEIPIFGTFLSEKIDFFFSILVYFHWKSAFWVRPCLKTSLWRHTSSDFHDFGINRKRRPYPIPRYQTIILWERQFKVHKVGGNPLPPPSPRKPCYKKGLVGRGLKLFISTQIVFHTSEFSDEWVYLWSWPLVHLRSIRRGRYKLSGVYESILRSSVPPGVYQRSRFEVYQVYFR